MSNTKNLEDLENTYLSRVFDDFSKLRAEDADLDDIYIKPRVIESHESARKEFQYHHDDTKSDPQPDFQITESLGSILLDHLNLVLLGDPGSGKSITLQYLAWCFSQSNTAFDKLDILENRVPILLSPKTCYWRAIDEEDVEAALEKEVSQHLRAEKKYVPDLVKKWLEEEKVILLLDGLDEIPNKIREHVVHKIQRFVSSGEFQGCRTVVSSRPTGYISLGHPFIEFTLQPLNEYELLSYVTIRLTKMRGIEKTEAEFAASNLVRKIRTESGLKTILGNPLFLKLLFMIDPDINNLPSHLGEVIGRFIRLSVWERAKKDIESKWTMDECNEVLTWIAWELQNYPEVDNDEDGLVKILKKKTIDIEDPRGIIHFLHEGMGLLDVNQYSGSTKFCHLLFREYFVARRLVNNWNENRKQTWAFIKPRLHHPEWRETLLLCSLLFEPSESHKFVAKIYRSRSQYENLIHRDKLLAGTFVAWGAQIKSSLRYKILGDLLKLFLELLGDIDEGNIFHDVPAHVLEWIILIERILKNITLEEQQFIVNIIFSRIVSSNNLSTSEILTTIREEILISRKPIIRSKSHQELLDLTAEITGREYGPPRHFQLKHFRKIVFDKKFRKWRRCVRAGIDATRRLRMGDSRTRDILLELLNSSFFAVQATDALVELDAGTIELANAIMNALNFHAERDDDIPNLREMMQAIGRIGQKNPKVVDFLIHIVQNNESEDDVTSIIQYAIAIAICKAAETDLRAIEYVISYWNNLLAQPHDQFSRDFHKGMKDGTELLRIASEEVIQYLISQIRGYQEIPNQAPRLLDQLLRESPKVLKKETDSKGNSWYTAATMRAAQIEAIQKIILTTVANYPPIGTSDEIPLMAIISHWLLKSTSLFVKLINVVAASDANLLAEELRHRLSSSGRERWPIDDRMEEFINQSILRLLDTDPQVKKSEYAVWEKLADESKADHDLPTWSLNVVKWQKCYFFFRIYWQTFGNFWNSGMDFTGGWEKVKEWNPYSMAALSSFSKWDWSSPNYRNITHVDWKEAEEEFQKGTNLALSIINNHDNKVIINLESILNAKSPGNPDSTIFDDQINKRAEALMDERIASIYALARLAHAHPPAFDILIKIARVFVNSDINDWENAPIPFSEFREHLFRSLGYIRHPNPELIKLMLKASRWDRERGHLSIIKRGIEAVEYPSPEVVDLLIEEYPKPQNSSLKSSMLEPLSNVKDSSSKLNNIMLNALEDKYHRLPPTAVKYFSNLSYLDTACIERILGLVSKNSDALMILIQQIPKIPGHITKRIKKIARRRSQSVGDIYRFALIKIQERATHVDRGNKPRDLDSEQQTNSFRIILGIALFLGLVLLLGFSVVLGTIFEEAQSVIRSFLNEPMVEYIKSNPGLSLAIFVGIGIVEGLLLWFISSFKNRFDRK